MSSLGHLLFERDLAALSEVPGADRWAVEQAGNLAVRAAVSPRSAPDERFYVKLEWKDYPGRLPASVVFLDPETGQKGSNRCWPNILGVRPPNDICACWTTEGFIAHPEWLPDPAMAWNPGDNPILTQLRYLQHEMDHNYQGRVDE